MIFIAPDGGEYSLDDTPADEPLAVDIQGFAELVDAAANEFLRHDTFRLGIV